MIVLASGSATRAAMLREAGVPFEAAAPRVDEAAVRAALAAEGAGPRDMADALAEAKARKVAGRRPEALVVGSDQVMDLRGEALGKVRGAEAVAARLLALSGRDHRLHSAAVACEGGAPVWRHVSSVRLRMRPLAPEEARALARRPALEGSMGYLFEEMEDLFEEVRGEREAILGMPMAALLRWLRLRGEVGA
ncbi:septum formation protein [Hasllibacter halocynthiae]|uniref:Nucleoside triphosphate pyrophosphatase n=1 Tax=Hasllibacter halocynthiae TaxID=595589 RepID=A0A2T0X2F2_9RHOB|nr:Maf family protein [Hasllibacter halocynthiae]PRY93129.1 septum formation protein [Hasllibacter halocynthiae]